MVVMVQSGEALLKVDQKNETLPLTDKKRPYESRSAFQNKSPYYLCLELANRTLMNPFVVLSSTKLDRQYYSLSHLIVLVYKKYTIEDIEPTIDMFG